MLASGTRGRYRNASEVAELAVRRDNVTMFHCVTRLVSCCITLFLIIKKTLLYQ